MLVFGEPGEGPCVAGDVAHVQDLVLGLDLPLGEGLVVGVVMGLRGVQGVGVGGWGGGHTGGHAEGHTGGHASGLDPGTSSVAWEGTPSTQGVVSAPVKVVLGGLEGGLGRVGATLGGAVS